MSDTQRRPAALELFRWPQLQTLIRLAGFLQSILKTRAILVQVRSFDGTLSFLSAFRDGFDALSGGLDPFFEGHRPHSVERKNLLLRYIQIAYQLWL